MNSGGDSRNFRPNKSSMVVEKLSSNSINSYKIYCTQRIDSGEFIYKILAVNQFIDRNDVTAIRHFVSV